MACASLILLSTLAGCGDSTSNGTTHGKADSAVAPRPHDGRSPIARFRHYVSMAPSNTELLYAIGADDKLQGVCTQCDFPSQVSGKPKVGNFVTADLEKLASLRPDGVFLVDGQEAMASMIEKQKAFKTRVVIIHNAAIDDIESNLVQLGTLTGRTKEGIEQAELFRDNRQVLQNIVGGNEPRAKPRVFFCVWPEPLVTIGSASYINDAITKCGGINIAQDSPGAYPRYNFEKLMVEQPDVIIMPAEADHDLAKRAPWSSLEAVKKNRLYFLPPRQSDRLSRPTLRTLEGMYWLAERIHPELVKDLSINKLSK